MLLLFRSSIAIINFILILILMNLWLQTEAAKLCPKILAIRGIHSFAEQLIIPIWGGLLFFPSTVSVFSSTHGCRKLTMKKSIVVLQFTPKENAPRFIMSLNTVMNPI